MSNPTSRRHFLQSLLAIPAVLAATKGLGATRVSPTIYKGGGITPTPPFSVMVGGLSIKVPSNRRMFWAQYYANDPKYGVDHHYYQGEWDGSFKLESGCSNPSFILADLMIRDGENPDWKAHYDFGVWCDELTTSHIRWIDENGGFNRANATYSEGRINRFSVNTVCRHQMDRMVLKQRIQMEFTHWKSTDPRYRKSWPGIDKEGNTITFLSEDGRVYGMVNGSKVLLA